MFLGVGLFYDEIITPIVTLQRLSLQATCLLPIPFQALTCKLLRTARLITPFPSRLCTPRTIFNRTHFPGSCEVVLLGKFVLCLFAQEQFSLTFSSPDPRPSRARLAVR